MLVISHPALLLFVALTRVVVCGASDAQTLVQQAVRALHAVRSPSSSVLAASAVLQTMNANTTKVICPFLAALVNEGVIDPAQQVFSKDELFELAVDAGLCNESATAEMEENFRNIPTEQVNIFDMEGNINEHLLSTGINDCRTLFPTGFWGTRPFACANDSVTGAPKCRTPDKTCLEVVPYKRAKFEQFWRVADTNDDLVLSKSEACAAQERYETLTNDANTGIQAGAGTLVLGNICGAFGILIEAFGETCDNITKSSLELVLINNSFPHNYSYPSERKCC